MKVNIKFSLVDPAAKADSTLAISDYQPWIDIEDLRRETISLNIGNFATCEHNQAILDGTQTYFPDDTSTYDWGWWSESMSDDNGLFESPPTIDITFGSNHKSKGLTIVFYPFSDDYANRVNVTWYASDYTTVLQMGTYQLNSNVGIIEENVAEWRRITIKMLSTNNRNRWIKLRGIEYGLPRTFEDSDINTASILEEVDPISDILSINTLNFQVKTHTPEFSPISGDIGDTMLMRKQPLTVTADDRPFGTFFLNKWEDVNNRGNTFDFSAIDAIGVMDEYEFRGGLYNDVLASVVLQQLFDICFPTKLIKMVLDNDFVDSRLTGWIPICTCREALQLICFAIGAVADTSRRDYVWIYKREFVDFAFRTLPTVNDYQPWTKLDNLKTFPPVFNIEDYATCEHNQAILDGTQVHLPDDYEGINFGWWSASMSDDHGNFTGTIPTLEVEFSANHKSEEISLYFYPFSDDYVNTVRATWYDDAREMLKSGTYGFDSVIGIIKETVTNYRYLKIEMLSTNNRNRFVKLRAINLGLGSTITLNEIYQGGKSKPTPYYNGVDVVAYQYTVGTEVSEVHNDILSAGEHEIRFSEPLHSLTISGGTILHSNANYAVINVDVQDTVILSGMRYIENKLIHSTRTEVLSGEVQSIVTFDQCKLITNTIASTIKTELFNYLKQRIMNNNKIRLGNLEPGYIVEVQQGRGIIGTIESMNINLRGEYAETRIIGDVDTTTTTSINVTARPEYVLAGKTFVDASGTAAVGTMINNGTVDISISSKDDEYTINEGYHNGNGKVSILPTERAKLLSTNIKQGVTILGVAGSFSGSGDITLQSKTVTPTKSQQNVIPDTGYDALSMVTVEAIPSAYANVTNVTAKPENVLANEIFVTSGGIQTTGTMVNNGAVNASINGKVITEYTIPKGYHNGSGKVALTGDIEAALKLI